MARKLRTMAFSHGRQPTYHLGFCRQCGKSPDLEGGATVDGNILVSAVTETLYERCNSQIPQDGRTATTRTFHNVPIDLVAAFCDTVSGL
jgi:hypothetical protein